MTYNRAAGVHEDDVIHEQKPLTFADLGEGDVVKLALPGEYRITRENDYLIATSTEGWMQWTFDSNPGAEDEWVIERTHKASGAHTPTRGEVEEFFSDEPVRFILEGSPEYREALDRAHNASREDC